MSRKVFTAGEVLAAADVNSFLMDQTVMSFAGTAARGSAIGTAVEGMTTFLEDSNLLSIFEGGVWRSSLAARGGVLQAVRTTTSTRVTASTNDMVDSTLTATITPKSASSFILVFVNQNGLVKGVGNASNSIFLRLMYPNGSSEQFQTFLGFQNQDTALYNASSSFIGIYSANSLSAQTFKTQIASAVNGQTIVAQESSSISSILLLEISN